MLKTTLDVIKLSETKLISHIKSLRLWNNKTKISKGPWNKIISTCKKIRSKTYVQSEYSIQKIHKWNSQSSMMT